MAMLTSEFEDEYDLASLLLVTPTGQDFSMYVSPRFKSKYVDRSYEGFTADIIRLISRRAKFFVDIGAHYGFYTLLAANSNPSMDIIALEPTPETFSVLERNVSLLGTRTVSTRRVAASDTLGTADFMVSQASDECGFASHALPPPLRSIQVPTTTLDQILRVRAPCPIIVKVDVAGSELNVLAGMRETLQRFDDVTLIVAFNPMAPGTPARSPELLLEEISGLGFEIFMISDSSRQAFRVRSAGDWRQLLGDASSANLFCVKRDRALSICMFAHSAGLGGAERSLVRFVEQLVSSYGAMCCVVVPSNGPLVKMLHHAGASCIISEYRWWCAGRRSTSVDENWANWIAKSLDRVLGEIAPLVGKIDPDVVWTQTIVIPWGAMTAAVLGKPHVWSVTEFGEKDHGLKFFWPFERIVADIQATSAIVFTSSKSIADELFPAAPPEKVRVRYPPISVPPVEAAEAEPAFFQSSSTIRIGVFAAVNPSKGQEDAVRALAQLARHHDVELLVAGKTSDQSYRDRLARLAEDFDITARLHFTGHLADPYPAMRACDIIVICSRNEAFGRVAIEASLVGTPVVYAAAGGMLETMIDGDTGLAYPPGDVRRLAECLEELIADPQRGRELSARGALNAINRFGGERQVSEAFAALLGLRHGTVPPAVMPRLLESAVKLHRVTAANAKLKVALAGSEAALRAAEAGFRIEGSKLKAQNARLRASLTKRNLELQAVLDSWIGRVFAGPWFVSTIRKRRKSKPDERRGRSARE